MRILNIRTVLCALGLLAALLPVGPAARPTPRLPALNVSLQVHADKVQEDFD